MADFDIGTSSDPHVRHDTFFSDTVGAEGRKREKMLDGFRVCSRALFERGGGRWVFGRADVVLRRNVARGRSPTSVAVFDNDDRVASRADGGLQMN